METSTPMKREPTRKDGSTSDKRNKRYKVGRACYSCRVKKIKCDGLQPCMQCKARRLPCTFSADGAMDDDDITANETISAINEGSTPTLPTRSSADTQQETQISMDTHQQLIENTLKTLNQLCTTCDGVWRMDEQQLLDNPTWISNSLSLAAPASISYNQRPMPSKKIQKQLIDYYYQHKYPLLHTIPRDLFLDQFEHSDSSISPLLLFAMFATSSDDIKADDYFNKAREMLDSFLEVPCLSTVVALCLMSLYEAKNGTDHSSRSPLFSAMAFRMCNQLGYGQHMESVPGQIHELEKRVVWCCYCLDKMTSIYLDCPWLIRLQDIMVDLPRCCWPNEDQEQMECYVAFIKLMQMAEQCLKPGRFMDRSVHLDETYTQGLDHDLTRWLQALPLHLHWTPLPTSNSTTTTVPIHYPRNASITHLHLLYNMIQQRLLLPFASSPTNHLLYLRSLSVANNLTQLVHHLSTQPDPIYSLALVSTATQLAVRVYLSNCGNQDQSIAMHARSMFKRILQSISTLLQQEQRSVPGMDLFLSRVNGALLQTVNDNIDPPIHNSIFINETEPTATDILTQTLRTSPSTSSSSSTPLWHSSKNSNNNITDHIYQPSPPSSLSPSSQQQQQQQQQYQVLASDPFDFLDSPSLDQVWNQRMAPSSVDALLYKSRFSMEDRQYNATNGGLLMSHAKLNDPLLLSSQWMMMRHAKEPTAQPFITPPIEPSNDLFWPLEQPPPMIEKKPQAVRGQQYTNIGLGVYASAHQHHNDVLRQRTT